MKNRLPPRSFLRPHIRDFLALRASMDKASAGWDYVFRAFERFLVEERAPSLAAVDGALISKWFDDFAPRLAPSARNKRLVMLRMLFRYLVHRGHCERDPTESLSRAREERVVPYVFTPREIERVLLEVPRSLGPRLHRYLSVLYQTLFFLLYAGGLRISEGVRLRLRDLDFERRTIRIEKTKFNKSRLVPFGKPAARVLLRFLEVREGRFGSPAPDDILFLSFRSGPLSSNTVYYRLRLILRRLGVHRKTVREHGAARLAPSPHSFRHAFAVHRLEQWYREEVDVLSKLPFLSTYLGHATVSSTQHYLTILHGILREAGRRFAKLSDDGDFLRP